MKKNIGKTDKWIRMLIGVLIIVAGAYNNSVWGVLGIIPVISSQAQACPLYFILGMSTAPKVHK